MFQQRHVFVNVATTFSDYNSPITHSSVFLVCDMYFDCLPLKLGYTKSLRLRGSREHFSHYQSYVPLYCHFTALLPEELFQLLFCLILIYSTNVLGVLLSAVFLF